MVGQRSGVVQRDEPQADAAERSALGVAVGEGSGRLTRLARTGTARGVGPGIRPHDRAMAMQARMPERTHAAAALVAAAAEPHHALVGIVHADEPNADACAIAAPAARVIRESVRRTPTEGGITMAVFALPCTPSPSREVAPTA